MIDWLFEEHLKKTGFGVDKKHYCAPVVFPKKNFVLHKVFFKLVCLFNRKISPQARMAEVVLFVIRKQPQLSGETAPSASGSA